MNRDDEKRGEGCFIWRLRRFHQGDVTSFHRCLHHVRVVEAKHAVPVAAPYEVGSLLGNRLYPAYVRGEAYLAAHRGIEAAAEFEKIIEHRGVVLNRPSGVLAHLGLARAYAMQGDTAKAKAAYQDFLTLWKDADPDIPILKQTKLEYAKLP